MEDRLKEQMLSMLLGSLTDEAKKFAGEEIGKIKQQVMDELTIMKGDAQKLKSELDEILTDCPKVITTGTVEAPTKELTHSAFDTIVKILQSAKRKEKNIMLVGGAGGGKTHLVKQIADAMQLPFYPMSVGLQTTKSDLLGFINATGGYVPSCVRLAYENGGVLLLDEFDAAHAGVVTILNSLLANGHCSFPDKIVNKNEKFICIVACNTYGQGGSLEYIGRNRLDGATLDRFIIVTVDYDKKLEKKLTNNDAWYKIVGSIRKNAENNGIKTIISPRACMDGADLLEAGFSMDEVINMTILKGCSEDVKKKLLKGVKLNPKEQENANESEEQKEETTATRYDEYELVFHITEKDSNCKVVKNNTGNDSNGEINIVAGGTASKIRIADWYGKSGIDKEDGGDFEICFCRNENTQITRNYHSFAEVVNAMKHNSIYTYEGFEFGKRILFSFEYKNGKVVEFEYSRGSLKCTN